MVYSFECRTVSKSKSKKAFGLFRESNFMGQGIASRVTPFKSHWVFDKAFFICYLADPRPA